MIECPNCHAQNDEQSRFCANCGTRLKPEAADTAPPPVAAEIAPPPPVVDSTDPTPPLSPPTTAAGPTEPRWQPPVQREEPEWRMSDPGPLPEPTRRRRTWLWVLGGVVGVILLACCLALVWANTIGEDFVNDLQTRVIREATESTINRSASPAP